MWNVASYAVVVLHVLYLVYQTFGALLGLKGRRWLVPHLMAVTWGVLIVVVQGRCPLTVLEKHLVATSGETPYTGSFLDHYVFGTLLPAGSQAWVYGAHLVVIVLTYVVVLVPGLGARIGVARP